LTESAQVTGAGWSISDIRPKAVGSGTPSREQLQGILDQASKFMFMEGAGTFYEEMAKTVRDLFSAEHVIIWITDSDGRQRPKVALGCPPDAEQEFLSLSHGEDYDQEMLKHANRISPLSYFVPAEVKMHIGWEAANLECMQKMEAVAKPRDSPDNWHDLDHLTVSILTKEGKSIGSIVICKTADGKIPSIETVRAIEIFSTICSVALGLVMQRENKAAIADAAEGRSTQISQILSFAREVLALEDPEKLFDSVLKILRELFGFNRCSISLLDENEGAFRYVALLGYPAQDSEYARTIRIPPESYKFYVRSEFLIGRNAYYIPAEQLPDDKLIWEIYSPDNFADMKRIKAEPRAYPGAWHTQDNLLFAIHDKQGRVIGLLCPDNPSDWKIPSLETIDGMGVFTSLVSIALENARYYSETIRAKKDIDVLNKLLFRDVSKINSDIREYLDEALSTDVSKDQRANYIRSAIQMIDSIIDLMHKVRKISSMKSLSSSDLQRLDLVDAVRNQMTRVLSQYAGRNVKGVYGSMPSNCYVLANELIGEMLSTVIKNAITHNYRDGPEVVISIDSMADEFNNKTFWEISISDNGPGIPDERKTPIFDLVAQIGESSGITGVSLSMAKSIVMLYGGSIWVENRVPTDRSRGSTFRILLPVA